MPPELKKESSPLPNRLRYLLLRYRLSGIMTASNTKNEYGKGKGNSKVTAIAIPKYMPSQTS